MASESDEEFDEGVVVGQLPVVSVPRHIKKRSLKNKALSVSFDAKELRWPHLLAKDPSIFISKEFLVLLIWVHCFSFSSCFDLVASFRFNFLWFTEYNSRNYKWLLSFRCRQPICFDFPFFLAKIIILFRVQWHLTEACSGNSMISYEKH